MSSSAISASRRRYGAAASVVPGAIAVLVAGTVAAGLLFAAFSRSGLGTPLPPFLMNWSPARPWSALVAVLVVAACAVTATRALTTIRSSVAFAVLTYALALALGLSVNAVRGGPEAWTHVFDLGPHGSFEAWREYLPALHVLTAHGAGGYISHFAALLPYLPTHAKGNPPGPVIAIHALGLTSPARLAAACIGLGALTAPFALGLGTALGGELRGRVAALLTAFSPALILFGVTSVDYVFAALATATAWLLVSGRRGAIAAGCVLAAVGSLLSWLLLAVPAWAVLVAWRRRGARPAVSVALAAGAAILALNGILALAFGYDPIAVLRALAPIYSHGIAAHRPYAYWVLGSPAAWLVMLGVPTAWLALRSLRSRDGAALALAGIVVFSALAGFTKAETERIWLPFVPLACVAAAGWLASGGGGAGRRGMVRVAVRTAVVGVAMPTTAAGVSARTDAALTARLRLALLALGAQAIVIEMLFNTVW